jgi:hypothetical protein
MKIDIPVSIGDEVFVISPKYNECEHGCYQHPEPTKWCKIHCPYGYKGIGVIEDTIDRIEITKNNIYYWTSRNGYRNIDNIFLTDEDAQQALRERNGVLDRWKK